MNDSNADSCLVFRLMFSIVRFRSRPVSKTYIAYSVCVAFLDARITSYSCLFFGSSFTGHILATCLCKFLVHISCDNM